MSDKHEYVGNFKPLKSDKKTIAKTLADYSAFTEGLQLFSSFAILLNFPSPSKIQSAKGNALPAKPVPAPLGTTFILFLLQ